MQINLGDDKVVKQERPTLDDHQGLLNMGFCEEISIKVEYNGEVVDWLVVNSDEITLTSPDTHDFPRTDLDSWKDSKLVVYLPAVDDAKEFRIKEQPFLVRIGLPVCSAMRLVIIPRRLDTMELDFGSNL